MAKVGRPKITLDDLPDGWKDLMLNGAKEGKSKRFITTLLKISPETFYRLKDDEEEFSDTIKECEELCYAWWEQIGLQYITNDSSKDSLNLNTTNYIFQMKNRFGWADKQQIDHTSKGESVALPMHTFIETDDE